MISLLFCSSQNFAQQVSAVKIDSVLNYVKRTQEKTLVINFWGTFCKPCLEEIPDLINSAKSNENVKLVLVSLDAKSSYPKEINKVARKHRFNKETIWWLDETDADYFCPKIDSSWSGSIPATLIINNGSGYRKFVEDKIQEVDLNSMIIDSFIKNSKSL